MLDNDLPGRRVIIIIWSWDDSSGHWTTPSTLGLCSDLGAPSRTTTKYSFFGSSCYTSRCSEFGLHVLRCSTSRCSTVAGAVLHTGMLPSFLLGSVPTTSQIQAAEFLGLLHHERQLLQQRGSASSTARGSVSAVGRFLPSAIGKQFD
ncbi:hypothetical protein WMY93_009141 [Mugilogobius chulae]|uniref:Uncharacterized protein n=1 Tax=Mugilogobius chulae TaxID=88201 RepID=A0AAW0PH58_9GOBI